MDALIARHASACHAFAHVAHAVAPQQWSAPTPCTEWNTRDLVEHVIGFHEFLLLRPMGVRANRPRENPAARWDATAVALFDALALEGMLDRATDLPGGGQSSPRQMIGALTTDVLVHTWDLSRAAEIDITLNEDLCAGAYKGARGANLDRKSGMFGPEVPVADDAPIPTRLIALYGRDPSWTPPPAP